MSDLHKQLNSLPPAQRAKLYRLLKASDNKDQIPRINVQERNNSSFPLSFSQEALWFLAQLYPHSSSYNVFEALQINGPLVVQALENALNAVILRHEVLRTIFLLEGDKPVQRIIDHYKIYFPIIDISKITYAEMEQEIQELLSASITPPLDFIREPPLRALLIRKDEEDAILLIVAHHMSIDFWSIEIVKKELFLYYTAFAKGEALSLPPLTVQYIDYACWQRNWLNGQRLSSELAYWQKQLAKVPLFLDLPTDRPRGREQTFNGRREKFVLPLPVAKQLIIISRQEEVTVFIALLAVFQLLLSRYSGQEDIVVGTPIAYRPFEETTGVVGLFLNTLLIRTDLSCVSSFRDLLAQIKKVTLEAYDHQSLPFMLLVQNMHTKRDLKYVNLFQVMFLLQHKSPILSTNLTIQPLEIENKTSKADLICFLEEDNEYIQGYFEYNTDLFEQQTIIDMIQHFQVLLASMVGNPDQLLREMSLLTSPEQFDILSQETLRPFSISSTDCIHTLFESQARQRPDAIALSDENIQITYQNLEHRSNQLARYLLKIGVTSEMPVGLYLERSWELVVGILGILKAGGVYVPIDPAYPTQRIAFILADAQVSVVVTQERLKEKLPSTWHNAVCLDRDWSDIALEDLNSPLCISDPASAAYLIYTSGSTGIPKGVVVSHANVARLFTVTYPIYQFDEFDVWALFHSIAFDFAVWELWGALFYGGRLVIVPYWTSRSPDMLYRLLVETQVTVLNQTPSAFSQFIQTDKEAGTLSPLLSLRLIVFGGEALNFSDLEPWLARHGDQAPRLFNMYGITETTVHVTTYPIRLQDVSNAGKNIIGRPLADLQTYVLDPALHLVPPGVTGELYVGGAGVARNYQHRPDLTAERFIPNPFALEKGERLYKTGDRVRYLKNGNIEYLGRIDQQVKIRGYRIELGEIESALKHHPRVRAAVVVQQGDVQEEKKLIAYLVLKQMDDYIVPQIRTFLRDQLPEYMVPSAFAVLETLPITTNGKLDQRMLPVIHEDPSGYAGVTPQTPVEEIVADIWMQVLHLSKVSVQDNFFDLGGHSLLATQVISRLRAIFQIDVPLKQLFAFPTIQGLARFIDLALQGPPEQGDCSLFLPEIVVASDREKIPLSFSQQRLWFLDQFETGNSAYNITMAFRIKGTLDLPALQQTCREIIFRHEILRTSFRMLDEYPQQVISAVSTVAQLPVGVVDLSQLSRAMQEAEKAKCLHEAGNYPFDLAHGPLLYLILLHLEDEYTFIISMHHIIFDGWSQGIFFQEVSLLYRTFLNRQGAPLAPLPIQYADYAIWQRSETYRKILEKQLGYWKNKLEGAPSTIAIFTDHPRPPRQTFKGATLLFQLPQELIGELRIFCKEENITLFMLFLAVFNILLYRYTNQDDIVIGTLIANRNQPKTEGLLGFFVNTLALRTDLSGAPSFRELLQRVRQMTLGAYAHQDVPFDLLVEELHVQRLSHLNPLFQILFDYQNISSGLMLENLAVQPLPLDTGIAKFDLALSIEDAGHYVQGTCTYSTDLFERETVARMMKCFQNLLDSAISCPDVSITKLSLLTEIEQQSFFRFEAYTNNAYTHDTCLHRLFEDQVRQTPDSIALVYDEQFLTYFELNRLADRLAFHLQTLEVGSEIPVGLCLPRSLELVIGILGILKSNGAYVPIDPFSPKERQNSLLADSKARVLLTQKSLKESNFSDSCLSMVCLDRESEMFASKREVFPAVLATSENLAYIIYTSGSTGAPKGVMISHRAICNHMLWMRTTWPLTDSDSVLQRTPASFDASVWEFFAPLISGARLVLAPPENKGSSMDVISTIIEQNVTILQLTPSVSQLLLEEPEFKRCRSLKRIYCGGEALSTNLVERLYNTLEVEVYNLYGPTETTVEASFWHCPRESKQLTASLGFPIANTSLHILDAHLQPVPPGVAGELYISGIGLARGYLHLPERTAEMFIPHPFGKQPGERLYKTRDLARYLSAGTIEFLGRSDYQLKFRGYRIEPQEIEFTLKKYPLIQEAIVTVLPNNLGDNRLVAYIVLRSSVDWVGNDVKSYLRTLLPDYMVPSIFVILEASSLLTSNGKINRHALPEPDWSQSDSEYTNNAPRTPVEQVVAEIWMELLGLTKVGLYDNFFYLGGHSLLAIGLAARLRKVFPLEVTLRSIFETPTIAQQAFFIEEKLLEKVEGLSPEEIQKFLQI